MSRKPKAEFMASPSLRVLLLIALPVLALFPSTASSDYICSPLTMEYSCKYVSDYTPPCTCLVIPDPYHHQLIKNDWTCGALGVHCPVPCEKVSYQDYFELHCDPDYCLDETFYWWGPVNYCWICPE